MTDIIRTPAQWTSVRSNTLAAFCLLMGIAGGWLIRGAKKPTVTGYANAASLPVPAETVASPESAMPSPARLKEMADAQAAPLLDQLKAHPGNPDVLTSLGNLYYDAQQYPVAVDYYGRALKGKPSAAAVRTDMATAYWYMGNVDVAIAEFNKALTYEPTNPNTLFNRGLVKWKGKKDVAGAVADWNKLLAANPNYEGSDKVKQMMAEATQPVAVKPE